MNHSHSSHNEGKEEVEGEEASQSCIVNREAASDSLNESAADVGDSGEKVRDDGGPSERHLPSGKDVSDEGSHYNEQK